VFSHNGFCVLGLDIAVPDSFGVDDHRGPCSHWSRQPDLLMRTLPASPASFESCCRRVCSSLLASVVQLGRGASGDGRCDRQRHDVQRRASGGLLRRPHFGARPLRVKPRPRPLSHCGERRRTLHHGKGELDYLDRPPGPICENESLSMSTDNLVSLKDDMVAFIEGHGMRRLPAT